MMTLIWKILNKRKGIDMMVTYIAEKIMDAYDKGGLDAGQTKYRAYFVRKSALKIYGKYKEDVDTILITDGYEDCIVEE